jgi:hypothetical protein
MRVRFDRIERRLNEMYAGIVERLAEIDFDLGEIAGNIDDLQLSLYRLHARLQRLNRDVHAFLDAEGRLPLVEALNGFLNFEELTGQPLDFDGFREGENVFFSGAATMRRMRCRPVPRERAFGDLDLVPELTSAPWPPTSTT